MKWRCDNRYLWFEIERNLSPPDAFYGIFYVQNPFAVPPSQELVHPRSRPFGPQSSALRASSLTPQTQTPNFAHERWEICRTNQNTAATALNLYYLTNGWSYGLQIRSEHSQGTSEQKPIKHFGERERGPIQGLPKFWGYNQLSQERVGANFLRRHGLWTKILPTSQHHACLYRQEKLVLSEFI